MYQTYEKVPCLCGYEARVVVCGVGSYVHCPWCGRSTTMRSTKADALEYWKQMTAAINAEKKEDIKMTEKIQDFIYIKTDHIHPHPENPRKNLGDLTELAESLKKNGVMQNLTVVPIEGQPGKYYALIGNRRHGAAKLAGVEELPCRIAENMSRKDQLTTMLEENMQRNDLTIYEQAQGFQLMLDLGETEDTIAEKTGFSKTTIRHRLNIAKLDQKELRKKEQSDCFQLTLKDLYELEKIEDINTRNKILREATDSRNLIWKAQSAAMEEKRTKKENQIVESLKKMGIKKAPKKVEDEQYSGKWIAVKVYDLDKDLPKKVQLPKEDRDNKELYYLRLYSSIRIIKPAKKQKRQLSPEELAQKQRDKNKKKITAAMRELDARRREFISNIISGKIDAIKDDRKIQETIWNILIEAHVFLAESTIKYFFTGKPDYNCTPEEKEMAKEKASSLSFTQSLLTVMHYAIENIGDIYDWQGYYKPEKGNIIKRAYEILEQYGWTFANEEEQQLIDGTHELYRKREDAK